MKETVSFECFVKTIRFTNIIALMAASGILQAAPANRGRAISPAKKPPVEDVRTAESPLEIRLPGAAAEAEFGLRLARTILVSKDPEENAIVSPIGVVRILAALRGGATGKSAIEIENALGLSKESIAAAPVEKSEIWKVATAIWADESSPLKPDFKDAAIKALGALAGEAPFSKSPEEARKLINDWASENTGSKVKELLSKRDAQGAKVVLADTAWFKDAWKTPFRPEATKLGPFTLGDGKKKDVPFVSGRKTAAYAKTKDVEVLVLPFATERFEAVCLLPLLGKRGKSTLGALERKLSAKFLAAQVEAATDQNVDVLLPKMDLTGLSTSLLDPLNQSGVKSIFTDAADFSRMAEGGANLKIGVFKQTAAFRLDEAGAEAVAATAAVAIPKSAAPPRQIATFHADRPFLILVRDKSNGTAPFIVRCANPATEPH